MQCGCGKQNEDVFVQRKFWNNLPLDGAQWKASGFIYVTSKETEVRPLFSL